MNKKIIALFFVLIIIISSFLIFNSLTDDSEYDIDGETEDYTTDDFMDEIDEGLLGEDDEIEIGEMV